MNSKIVKAFAIGFVCVATAALALYDTGWGNEGTATTTPQELSGFTANTVSFKNDGTNTIYTLANCTSNTFTTRLAAGTCIPIYGDDPSYTFDCREKDSIENIWYATTNLAAPFHAGTY